MVDVTLPPPPGAEWPNRENRIGDLLRTVERRSFPRAGGRKAMLAEIDKLHQVIEHMAGLATPENFERMLQDLEAAEAAWRTAEAEVEIAQKELANLRAEIVETGDIAMLQEIGVYEYRHPMQDSQAYADSLKDIRDSMKQAVKDGKAVTATENVWTVDGSEARGRKMIKDTSKLLLRAYNSDANALVDKMRPYRLDASIKKLDQSRRTIDRLGEKPMSIAISDHYHELRTMELELVADWLVMKEEEKEEARAERERLREEAKARKEIEAERERLRKERTHYAQTIAKLRLEGGSEAEIAGLESELLDIDEAIDTVDFRAANINAGHVYVISNVGSFGARMVKIGMTRRLEPMDRVKELGDASVPFGYDLHALVFSEDAVGLERQLHDRFADQRVNLVNMRREFFYATPDDVRDALPEMGLTNIVTEFHSEALAEEWRASEATRRKEPSAEPI